jgi:regulator of protease activity HflC (stomatin/prohibitin superfamily)
MGSGRDQGLDEDCVKKSAGCFCCSAVITGIILFALSFSSVEEAEMCLSYNTITREVDPSVISTPGTKFTGIDHAYICFPKLVQNFDFQSLAARTQEGLDLTMDISLEYKLVPAELKQLFDAVNEEYKPFFKRVALSTIRNAASRYNATSFVKDTGGRAAIQQFMEDQVNAKFQMFHATVIALQLRKQEVNEEFERQINEVVLAELDIDLAQKQRGPLLQKEENDKLVAQQNAEKYAFTSLEDARASRRRAEVEVSTDEKQAWIAARAAVEVMNRNRQTVITGAHSQFDAKVAERKSRVQEARNELTKLAISFASDVDVAEQNAIASKIDAQASAAAIERAAQAAAEGLAKIKDAERQQFVDLKGAADMSQSDLLRFVWMNTLKQYQNTPFYVDYKKVPMLLETGVDPPPGGLFVGE